MEREHDTTSQAGRHNSEQKLILGARERRRLNFFFALLIILLIAAISVAGYYMNKAHEADMSYSQESLTGPSLTAEIAKIAVLPGDETPIIATVTDPAQLGSQQFFQHAEKGDKVLIFPKAKKALLYRPSTKQIVEMMLFEVPPAVAALGQHAP